MTKLDLARERLLSPKEAGALVGLGERTIRRLCAAGMLRHIRLPGVWASDYERAKYRIPMSALEEFGEQHAEKALKNKKKRNYKPKEKRQ